jgi:cold shock CspA family protein
VAGRIKTLIKDRGFRFIRLKGSQDVFLHARELQGIDWEQLDVDDLMSFDLEPDFYGKGPRVINVTYVRPDQTAPAD